jgi:hypothetical protein
MVALCLRRMRRRAPYRRVLFYTLVIYLNTPPFLIECLEPGPRHRSVIGYQIPNPCRPVFVLNLFIRTAIKAKITIWQELCILRSQLCIFLASQYQVV